MARRIDVYIESGAKRVFAVALDWPGWARSARTEDGALHALAVYAPRYQAALGGASPDFAAPDDAGALRVVERMAGNATTDFGAPSAIASADATPFRGATLQRQVELLEACWHAFDATADAAARRSLRVGARGGGRSVAAMVQHIREADTAYVAAIGGSVGAAERTESNAVRRAFVVAVRARAAGELPDRGPRGGARWPARFAIRRSAWHALDHAWEIEDRLITPGAQPPRASVRG